MNHATSNGMRVLILTTEYFPAVGGSELAIYNLTKRLPDVKFDIIKSGFGGKWLMPLTGFFRALSGKYDVIHAWQASYAGGAGWLLKLFFPHVPFIVTLQEGKNLEWQNFFIRFFRCVILRKADIITSISAYLQEFAKKMNPKARHVLLPNGVDVKLFSSDGKKKYDIVSSSRLVEKNGVDTLVRAMALLPDNIKLLLIGDGPLRNMLEGIAKSLGVMERVTFAGAVVYEKLPEYLASASVFVRPSRSEGLGIAFLDAMAARLPIVGTPVGGIPDFLKDRETGLFCKPDSPQSVADAVMEILEDATLRKKLVENARRLVEEKYNWDMLAKQYYEIISNYSRI